MFMLFIATHCHSQDLGVLGKRYPFAEEDYYEVLMAQVRDAEAKGVLAQKLEEQKKKVRDYIERPQGITLPVASQSMVHYVDPTYQLEQDILDDKGNVLYPQGFTFNPLHYMSWDKRFCMIDADVEAQIVWAEKTCTLVGRDRIVLVNGAFLATQKLLQRQIYFDQYGKISSRFHVRYLPSLAVQEGDLIRVEAYVVE